MTAPFSGGCACGSIRYVCARAPVAMLNCHCRDCQRSSGAPFASGVLVRVADTEITVRRRRTRFVLTAEILRLAAFAPTVARLYLRAAKRLPNLCPSAFPRWTTHRGFSRCWISGHPVRNRGFALIRQFLTIRRRLKVVEQWGRRGHLCWD